MDYSKEVEGKRLHDPYFSGESTVWFPGAVIVGAGPSGLAVAVCLKRKKIPTLILESSNHISSLWNLKTYDRLKLHLPKQFCQLPFMQFPSNFPTYPSKQQFLAYLEAYTHRFDIRPVFNTTVVNAEFDREIGLWRVKTVGSKTAAAAAEEYLCPWLVAATGENAEEVVPEIDGMEGFVGPVLHTSSYKSGEMFEGKRVLVVGCGNSGMEVCLDLCNYNARPSLVVRHTVHVLPQEMLGRSTFELSMWLIKWLPVSLVDIFILSMSRLLLRDTAQLGLVRPKLGPFKLKNKTGKTPVLDIGTLAKIKTGHIKVCPKVKRLMSHSAEFVDGKVENFDAVILATGYKSNVPKWLKGASVMFSKEDGWRSAECGLYAVGFTKRGLFGAAVEAERIADDIEHSWKAQSRNININPSPTRHSRS